MLYIDLLICKILRNKTLNHYQINSMTYKEIIKRIEGLDKSKILITDGISKKYSKISLKYKGVRMLDLTRSQFNKLKKLGYSYEVVIC